MHRPHQRAIASVSQRRYHQPSGIALRRQHILDVQTGCKNVSRTNKVLKAVGQSSGQLKNGEQRRARSVAAAAGFDAHVGIVNVAKLTLPSEIWYKISMQQYLVT
jgi:hypothetical protein